ncbi:MAG: hypothetical protein AAFQ76_16630, partial [Cyanobacteria bacterium J06626_26]
VDNYARQGIRFSSQIISEKIVVLIMNAFAVTLVEFLTRAVRVYFTAGLIFAVLFSLLGVQRTDPGARGLAPFFRLIIIPGVSIFWPLFALRLVRGKQHPIEQTAHRQAAKFTQST